MLTTLHTAYTDTRAGDLAWALGREPLPALAILELELRSAAAVEAARRVPPGAAGGGAAVCSETVACMPGSSTPLPLGVSKRSASGSTSSRRASRRSRPARSRGVRRSCSRWSPTTPTASPARSPARPHAFTALLAQRHAGQVRWRTWHSYPQEGRLVATRTRVGRAGGRRGGRGVARAAVSGSAAPGARGVALRVAPTARQPPLYPRRTRRCSARRKARVPALAAHPCRGPDQRARSRSVPGMIDRPPRLHRPPGPRARPGGAGRRPAGTGGPGSGAARPRLRLRLRRLRTGLRTGTGRARLVLGRRLRHPGVRRAVRDGLRHGHRVAAGQAAALPGGDRLRRRRGRAGAGRRRLGDGAVRLLRVVRAGRGSHSSASPSRSAC